MQQGSKKVEDVMQTSIHFIEGLASISDALEQIRIHKITALVIERRHEGDEYGFISIDKIAERVVARNKPLQRTSVYEVMDKPTLTLDPNMAVKYAIRLLSRLGHHRALVVDDSGARGLVTLRDLVLCYGEENKG